MAKRGQNEGSIYKRGDGRWAAAINLGYQGGKLRRKTFYGKTRAEVADKLSDAINDLKKGLPVATERQTVAQFLERWLRDCAKPKVRPKTLDSYEFIIKRYLRPDLGNVQLTQLSPQRLQAHLNSLVEKGYSARTAQLARTVLRVALGQALKWGMVARNVATLVDPPRYIRPEVKPLGQDEVKTFLKAIKGDRLEALYLLTLALGLREGEVLGLRWQDVDLKAAVLRVNNALQRVGGKLTLVAPKTARSRRTLPIPQSVVKALRAHRARQGQERLLAGSDWQESGFVFTTKIGTPIDARNLLRWYHALLENAELPSYRFHDLRHSCASMLLTQHVPARVVMDVLGHSQISLTMDTYSHVMPTMLREAAEKMEAALKAGKK